MNRMAKVKQFDEPQNNWMKVLQGGVTSGEELSQYVKVNTKEIERVISLYPMRINPYYIDLMSRKGSSLIQQVVPDLREFKDKTGCIDPLEEEKYSPVDNIIHRYPDRVLFLVSNECGVYCRFCTRKRWIGKGQPIPLETLKHGLAYIRDNPQIRDVLLSGGDPLILSDDRLEWIIQQLRQIGHVNIIRIGSRIPGILPQRITFKFVQMVKRYHPIFMNLHFNHPDEITDEVKNGCNLLADAGISLGSQTVLLKGINDNPLVLRDLMMKLLALRIRPYYLLQGDLTQGTEHFRTRIDTSIRIFSKLQNTISGLAVPRLMVDLPGGGGKVPLTSNYLVKIDKEKAVFKNTEGENYEYPQPCDS